MNKKKIIYVLVVVFSIIFIFVGNRIVNYDSQELPPEEVYFARIIEINDIIEHFHLFGGMEATYTEIHFSARITTGERRGEIVEGVQIIDDLFIARQYEVGQGDRILLVFAEFTHGEAPGWIFIEHNRSNTLIYLCIVFMILLVLIGKKKGLTTIIAVSLTCASIFFVYIPSILNGHNIYASTIIISIFIIVMSLITIDGLSKKTLCAILGNIGGVAVSGIIAIVMNNLLKLTGYIDEDSVFLSVIMDNPIDLRAVIWGSIVIGALGAIMDVAMTIASSMNELSEHMENKSFSKMLKSGMNIGRDAIGTMTNTLILAYIGGSLALVLLLIANSASVHYLFNMEMIAVEVIQAVIGSMGILFAVPFTAAFAAYIFNKRS